PLRRARSRDHLLGRSGARRAALRRGPPRRGPRLRRERRADRPTVAPGRRDARRRRVRSRRGAGRESWPAGAGTRRRRGRDDDPALAKRLEDDPRALPFAILPAAPTVTIIGSAGGTEIVTALHLGAKHVTGIELNPVTVGLLRGPFKAYTGNLADDPRVRLV